MSPRQPPTYGGWREILRFMQDPVSTIAQARAEHGDAFRLEIGPEKATVFATATAAMQVIQKKQRNYPRADRWMATIQELTKGANLFNSDGASWLWRRRTMQPAFQRARVNQLAEVITSVTDRELDTWPIAEVVDLQPHCLSLTMAVVGHTLFGEAFERDREELQHAFKVMLEETLRRLILPVRIPEAVPTPHNLSVRRARDRTFAFADELVAECRRDPDRPDLLGMLAAARDPETGGGLSDEELRNEALVMVHAGHETTASALASSLWLLGRHREWQNRLRDEVAAVLGEGPITAEAIGRCEQLDRFVHEALRLYPPAWATASRVAVEDDVVDGFAVPAGEQVWIALRELHRNEAYWDRPHEFDPDRFLPERSEGRPRWAWAAFAGGRRRCIGEHLAMLELRIVLARLLARFEVVTSRGRGDEPPLHVGFTLAPRGVRAILFDVRASAPRRAPMRAAS